MFAAMKILSGTAHPVLADSICSYLNVARTDATVTTFPDGESFVKINENVRGSDVFIVQPTCPPTNHNIMELLIMVDAARRASAERITAVIPFFGYARQDRKDQPRVPITAKLVANLLTAAGVNRVLTVDLHVSPDVGGIKMSHAFSKTLGADFAIVAKHRSSATEVQAINVIGEVEGRDVLLVDDMTETAGTLTAAARLLKERGAKRILAGVTHAVLGEMAFERLAASPIEQLICTNSTPMAHGPKVAPQDISPILGEAIRRIHQGESVTSLFDNQ